MLTEIPQTDYPGWKTCLVGPLSETNLNVQAVRRLYKNARNAKLIDIFSHEACILLPVLSNKFIVSQNASFPTWINISGDVQFSCFVNLILLLVKNFTCFAHSFYLSIYL